MPLDYALICVYVLRAEIAGTSLNPIYGMSMDPLYGGFVSCLVLVICIIFTITNFLNFIVSQ